MLSKLGVAATSYMIVWKPHDTLEFLEHCHQFGAAGIQAPIYGDTKAIRARAEEYGMYIEAMVPMPTPGDTAEFEKALQDAQAVGAVAMRAACLDTRRYETFSSLAEWQEHVAYAHASIQAALPLLARYKIPLGLENHKDWTAEEALAIMQRYGGDYFGSCLDFGNNISLLDSPMDVIEKLAPYAVCVHLKDMAVAPSEQGFLLSEVVLGDGYVNLVRAIELVRSARPETKFSLEMITRDPLSVPCLTDRYWATFPERSGLDLARTLRFVQEHRSAKPLPRGGDRTEDENVAACLRYGREKLGL